MRKALMTAQRMADDLVKEAEQKKEAILAQAERFADARRAELAQDLNAEEYRLKKAKDQTAAFVEKVRSLHALEAEYLSQLEELCPPPADSAADAVSEKASEIDDNVRRLLVKAAEDAAAENRRVKAAEEEPEDLSNTAEFSLSTSYADEEFPPDTTDYGEKHDRRPPAGSRINFADLQFGQDYEIT